MTKCDRHASAWSSCSKGRRCGDREVLVDWNTTICELANDAGLAPSTVLNILKKQLGMQKITSRCVPYDLTENQKMAMIRCRSYTLGVLWTQRWGLLMVDLYYWRDLGQSLWTTVEMPIKRVASSRVTAKSNSSADRNQSTASCSKKKMTILLNNPPIILHDNARVHIAGVVTDLLNRWGWEVLYHPSYSPDLSICDYDIILKMKEPLRGTCYHTVRDVLQGTNCSLRNIQRLGSANGIQRPPIWYSD